MLSGEQNRQTTRSSTRERETRRNNTQDGGNVQGGNSRDRGVIRGDAALFLSQRDATNSGGNNRNTRSSTVETRSGSTAHRQRSRSPATGTPSSSRARRDSSQPLRSTTIPNAGLFSGVSQAPTSTTPEPDQRSVQKSEGQTAHKPDKKTDNAPDGAVPGTSGKTSGPSTPETVTLSSGGTNNSPVDQVSTVRPANLNRDPSFGETCGKCSRASGGDDCCQQLTALLTLPGRTPPGFCQHCQQSFNRERQTLFKCQKRRIQTKIFSWSC